MKKITYIFALLFITAITFTGCREEKSTGEKMEDGIEEVGEDIEEGVEEVEDEVEDATDDN